MLIRHDIQNEAPPYPRGGFLVPKRLLPEILAFFFGFNRVVAVYEAADPVLNGYNLNLLFESATNIWDLSPHEVFSITISPDGKIAELRRVSAIDDATYEESRQLRVRKLQKKFQESPTPELARRIYADLKFSSTLEEYLKNLSSPLFKAKTYVPISQALVTNTVDAILNSNIIELFLRETGAGFPLNFSTHLSTMAADRSIGILFRQSSNFRA